MNKKVVIGVVIAVVVTFILTFSASFWLLSKDKADNSVENSNVETSSESNVNQNTQSKEEANSDILDNMKKKNSNMFNDMFEKQKAEHTTVDDPVQKLDDIGKKMGGFWQTLVYLVQHINPFFVTIMSLFGFAMSWLYRNSPLRSKGWLVFAIGAPILFILSIYLPPIYSSFQ